LELEKSYVPREKGARKIAQKVLKKKLTTFFKIKCLNRSLFGAWKKALSLVKEVLEK